MFRFFVFFFAVYACDFSTMAQIAPAGNDRQISGQIRIDGHLGPQGIEVLLDRARGRDVSFSSGTGELDTTMTDSRGRFSFEHIDGDSRFSDGKVYIVTVRHQGYRQASQIVDLSATPHGYVNLELQRIPGGQPNVPDEGPDAAISAKQPASQQARKALARGQELLLEKHNARASIEQFKKAVKGDPGFAPSLLLLGTAYMQTGAWKEAQEAFEKASKADAGNAIAFIGIGAALNEQQRWAEAQAPLKHRLELKPDSAEAHYEIARGLWALNNWQAAEPHAVKAIELNRSYPGPHALMGNIYLRERNANSALEEYREYLKLNPSGDQAAEVKKMVLRIEKALGERQR